MADLTDVKVGDTVWIVPQRQRWGKQENGFTATVTNVARKYAIAKTSEQWVREYCFHRDCGASKEKPDSNARVNGFGFDVYHNEAEVEELDRQRKLRDALHNRVVTRWGGIKEMPIACVEKIHAILNEYGVE
jgi:hypothetical protein